MADESNDENFHPAILKDVLRSTFKFVMLLFALFIIPYLVRGYMPSHQDYIVIFCMLLGASVLMPLALWNTWRISIVSGRKVFFHRIIGCTVSLPIEEINVIQLERSKWNYNLKVLCRNGSLNVTDCPAFRSWAIRMQRYVPDCKMVFNEKIFVSYKSTTIGEYIAIALVLIAFFIISILSFRAFGGYYWIRGECCEYGPFIRGAALWSALVAVGLIAGWRVFRKTNNPWWIIVIRVVLLTIVIGSCSNTLIMCGNAWLDQGPLRQNEVTISDIHVVRDEKQIVRRIYLEYKDWKEPKSILSVKVEKLDLERIKPGMKFIIETGNGYFGHEWRRRVILGGVVVWGHPRY